MLDLLRIDECKSKKEWNEFVKKHGTLHHLFEWTYVNQETFSCRCVNLACWDGPDIIAIYPFIIRGTWPLRWYVSPNDFGGGPIGDPEAVEKLIQQVDLQGRKSHTMMNTVRYGQEDITPFRELGYEIVGKKNLVIDISRSQNEIWTSLKDKARNSIRKAKSQGIVVAEGEEQDLKQYFILLAKHSTQVGYRPRSERFIKALLKYLDCTLLVARWKDQMVGGCLYLNFGKRTSAINAVRDPDKKELRVGEAIHWAGILHFKEKGYTEYDFMSRNDNHIENGQMHVYPGLSELHRFKMNWRPKEETHFDCNYVYSQAREKGRRVIAKVRDRAIYLRSKLFSYRAEAVAK